MHHFTVALLLSIPFLIISCDDSTTVVTSNAQPLYADQQFYPMEEGTFWRYRIDTTGVTGPTVRDVGRVTSRIMGRITFDSLVYSVQTNETVMGISSTIDTVFVRKDDQGVFFSSPTLRSFSLFPGLPGFSGFPKEYLILPKDPSARPNWVLINFEFNQIPFFPIYFRVTASYLGRETIQTDFRTFKNCARVKIDIDARLPNPANPQDIFNPLIIRENASFWFAQPLGLVVGDGNEAIFTLLNGRIPIGILQRRIHQEVIGLEIVQPPDTCVVK